jgi:1-acyl-sn-glycerol-3-phosphate acyltransferase
VPDRPTPSPRARSCYDPGTVIDKPVWPSDGELAGACGREPLVDAITAFLAHAHARHLPEIRASLERVIDDAGRGAIDGLSARLAGSGRDWNYFPGDPLAKKIHHALAPRVLRHQPTVSGLEHVPAIAARPVVLIANHLSYSDANLLEVVLEASGAAALANRLTVIAGPKVYSNLRRRFSSLCFGTIKVPQSTARSSAEAVMGPRDVARAARRAIAVAHARLERGDALLVFGEGNRSRSAAMQRFLPGVARYLEPASAWVLPIAIAGTHRLFPIDGETLTPVPLAVHIGRPVAAADLRRAARGDRRLMMDALGYAVAALLPLEYRGVYAHADATERHREASRLAESLLH